MAKPGGIAQAKEDAREERFKLNTTLEEKISKEWRNMALEACDLPIKAYWVCRQEAGLSVLWKCRAESEAMKQCTASHTGNKEEFARYRDKRFHELAPQYYAYREKLLEAKYSHYSNPPEVETQTSR